MRAWNRNAKLRLRPSSSEVPILKNMSTEQPTNEVSIDPSEKVIYIHNAVYDEKSPLVANDVPKGTIHKLH